MFFLEISWSSIVFFLLWTTCKNNAFEVKKNVLSSTRMEVKAMKLFLISQCWIIKNCLNDLKILNILQPNNLQLYVTRLIWEIYVVTKPFFVHFEQAWSMWFKILLTDDGRVIGLFRRGMYPGTAVQVGKCTAWRSVFHLCTDSVWNFLNHIWDLAILPTS